MIGPRSTSVDDCALVRLSWEEGPGGGRAASTDPARCPFSIRRVYYLFDIPAGADRGGHAHRELQQILVAAAGSFDVLLDDGTDRRTITLNRPDHGLRIVPGIWRELENFSAGSICLVIASHPYDESDYLREHSEFLSFREVRNVDEVADRG
jgi:hypothetical protein